MAQGLQPEVCCAPCSHWHRGSGLYDIGSKLPIVELLESIDNSHLPELLLRPSGDGGGLQIVYYNAPAAEQVDQTGRASASGGSFLDFTTPTSLEMGGGNITDPNLIMGAMLGYLNDFGAHSGMALRYQDTNGQPRTAGIGGVRVGEGGEESRFLRLVGEGGSNVEITSPPNSTLLGGISPLIVPQQEQIQNIATFDSMLNQIAKHSGETSEHIHRVASLLMLCMQNEESLQSYRVLNVIMSALLHDLGKGWIPENILHYRSGLTLDMWEIMRGHPMAGARGVELILGENFSHNSLPFLVALLHHERYDGSGYPFGLKGNQIPSLVQIISVIDAVEAMMGKRRYNNPKALHEVIDEVRRCCGTQFGPLAVSIVVSTLHKCRDEVISIMTNDVATLSHAPLSELSVGCNTPRKE